MKLFRGEHQIYGSCGEGSSVLTAYGGGGHVLFLLLTLVSLRLLCISSCSSVLSCLSIVSFSLGDDAKRSTFSQSETICMKCRNLFSWENKKNISNDAC